MDARSRSYCISVYISNIAYYFHFRVWSVRYNHFHDQLLLTSSSDSRVILNNIMSLSSEPFGHLDDEDEEDGALDKGSVLKISRLGW